MEWAGIREGEWGVCLGSEGEVGEVGWSIPLTLPLSPCRCQRLPLSWWNWHGAPEALG